MCVCETCESVILYGVARSFLYLPHSLFISCFCCSIFSFGCIVGASSRSMWHTYVRYIKCIILFMWRYVKIGLAHSVQLLAVHGNYMF